MPRYELTDTTVNDFPVVVELINCTLSKLQIKEKIMAIPKDPPRVNKRVPFARFVQKTPFPHNAQILAKTKQSNAHSQRYIKSTTNTSTHALPQQLYRGLVYALT